LSPGRKHAKYGKTEKTEINLENLEKLFQQEKLKRLIYFVNAVKKLQLKKSTRSH